MSNKTFNKIITGLEDSIAYIQGDESRARVHKVRKYLKCVTDQRDKKIYNCSNCNAIIDTKHMDCDYCGEKV